MRATLSAALLIGPILLSSATPRVLDKSIAEIGKPASPSWYWTGRISGERTIPAPGPSTVGAAPRLASLSRTALRPRFARNALQADVSANTRNQKPGIRNLLLPITDQPDILPHHRAMASEVLRAMPAQCLATLQSLYVRYDNPQHRGLAGKNSIIIAGNLPDNEFRALLVHEFGHVLDLGCITGTASAGASEFRDGADIMWQNDPSLVFYRISWIGNKVQREGTKAEDFVSGYASWDPFEDLSESLAYYVFQQDTFRIRAKTNTAIAGKLAWIETFVFPSGLRVAQGEQYWDGTVPWDTTKLAYTWGGVNVARY
jgi:hypothetical protein